MIAEAIIGLNGKSDDALKAMGLAENEIKHVRDSHEKLMELGVSAVKELKTSATNDNGVEHLLANAVVHDVKLLGPIVKDGHSKISDLPTQVAANDEKVIAPVGHVERLNVREATNDDQVLGVSNGR